MTRTADDTDETRSGRGWEDVAAGAFLIVASIAYVVFAARVESHGSDTSTYFGLAQSLVRGDGYRFNFEPHTVYPPGYPLILAGLMTVVGESFATLVRVSAPFFLLGLGFVYLLVRRERDPRTALAVVVLAATSDVAFFWTAVGLHSEIPYLTISACALLCADLAGRASSPRARVCAIAAATLCVAYLPLVRSIGVTLLAGLVFWILLPSVAPWLRSSGSTVARAKRWAPAVALGVLVLAGWMSWGARVEGYAGDGHMSSYAAQVMKADPHEIDAPTISVLDLPARAVRMAGVRVRRTAQVVLNLPNRDFSWSNPVGVVILLTLMGLIGVGFLRSVAARATLTDCYVLAYVGMLLLWPFDEGRRFLFPIQPFLLMYAIDGVNVVGGWVAEVVPWSSVTGRLLPVGKAALLLALAGLGIASSKGLAVRNLETTPPVRTNATTLGTIDWVRENTPEDAVLMLDEMAIMHRLTGRRTYRFPLLTDPVRIEELIAQTGTDYIVVLDEPGPGYFRPNTMRRFEVVRARDPERFEVVHSFEGGWVYRVGAASGG